MIKIANLTKVYSKRIVLDIKQLDINTGEIFGLVGNNGAGKTTLMRLMLDLIEPQSGNVTSDGTIVSGSESWKDHTASYLDESFLIEFLTAEEYFYFIGNLYGYNRSNIDDKLNAYKGMFNDEILGQKKKLIRDYSKGNKQKIGIVSTLLSEPKIIIMDEPFNGLDPSSQIILKRVLVNYCKKNNATIIISSHDLNHVTEICNRIALIEKGIIIRDIKNDNGSALAELESYFAVESI